MRSATKLQQRAQKYPNTKRRVSDRPLQAGRSRLQLVSVHHTLGEQLGGATAGIGTRIRQRPDARATEQFCVFTHAHASHLDLLTLLLTAAHSFWTSCPLKLSVIRWARRTEPGPKLHHAGPVLIGELLGT